MAPAPSIIVQRAKEFAINSHNSIDHRRKYTNVAYAVHLEHVVDLVSAVTGDPDTLAAAWLHDVVEDTPITIDSIETQFGKSIADLVSCLTDVSRPTDGNRSTRKELDRQHLANASPKAKTVKLADLIDNCLDISLHDPKFATVYLREMGALLEVLSDGNPDLYKLATRTREVCLNQLLHVKSEF